MLVGGMPFRSIDSDNLGKTVLRLLDDMRAQRYMFPGHLSSHARDLVSWLLCPEPKKRITIAEVLHHVWFAPGLPPTALSMNDAYLKLPRACVQTEEEIQAIVKRAALGADRLDGVSCNNNAYSAYTGASTRIDTRSLARQSPEQPLRVL
jgi:serine/threonine protein kinase